MADEKPFFARKSFWILEAVIFAAIIGGFVAYNLATRKSDADINYYKAAAKLSQRDIFSDSPNRLTMAEYEDAVKALPVQGVQDPQLLQYHQTLQEQIQLTKEASSPEQAAKRAKEIVLQLQTLREQLRKEYGKE